jgi:hypothetical protein
MSNLVLLACPKCRCMNNEPEWALKPEMTCVVPSCKHKAKLSEWLSTALELKPRGPMFARIPFLNTRERQRQRMLRGWPSPQDLAQRPVPRRAAGARGGDGRY